MRHRPPRIADASTLIALFDAHPRPLKLLDQAKQGLLNLIIPTTAIAVAQDTLREPVGRWEKLMGLPGVRSVSLAEHCAMEIGLWSGDLATRHAVHESHAIRAAVVTREPALYKGLGVSLIVF